MSGVSLKGSGRGLVRLTVLGAGAWLAGLAPAAALQPDARPTSPTSLGAPWARMQVAPGGPVDMRPFPPKTGRKRCVAIAGLAGAQMFGDRAMELTMKDGRRFRLFFGRECPALSFYQGFYYRRQKAGQLCAGRDSIGARSGGECPIASVIQVPTQRR